MFIQICWYLAAVVQVQLCKYFIEINDGERESTVWGEINVLRFVHCVASWLYGLKSFPFQICNDGIWAPLSDWQ